MTKGLILEVLDTPGLFDTDKPAEELRNEFLNCMTMTNPGPHAFLLIMKMNRVTDQEKKALQYLKEIFGGDQFLRHTIIVITRKEDLGETFTNTREKTCEEINLLFEKILEKSPDLHHIVTQCKNRYFLLSNKGKVDGPNRTEQASQLLSLFKKMTLANGNTFYSYKYFIMLEEERRRRKTIKKRNDAKGNISRNEREST